MSLTLLGSHTQKKISMENRFRYILEPYGSGRRYEICPSCGQTRYVRYVDTETGEYLPIEYGRCERINNCGYHKSPKELIINNLNKNVMNNDNQNLVAKEEISEISEEKIARSRFLEPVDEKNIPEVALLWYLINYYGKKAVLRVAQMYRLYLCRIYVKDGKLGIGFPQIEKNGKTIRQLKIMAYNPKTGRRLKNQEEFLMHDFKERKYQLVNALKALASWYFGKFLMNKHIFKSQQCFFGCHLLLMFPDKTVMIVESEKSAIIGALENDNYIWVSTCGQFGCNFTKPEVFECLRGHKVVLAPDLAATEDWKLRAETLVAAGIDVSVYTKLEEHASTEDKANGLDIADFFLRKRIQDNPQLIEAPVKAKNEVKKADIPDFDDLFSGSAINSSESQTNSISSEEFKARLSTGDDLEKSDKMPNATLEHDFSDIDKIIGLNADAVADIA